MQQRAGEILNQFPVIGEGHLLNLRLSPAEAAQLNGKYFQSPTDPEGILPGCRGFKPREQPALLHPYFDPDPAEHLEFTPNGHVLHGQSETEVKAGEGVDLSLRSLGRKPQTAHEKAQIEAENKYLMAYIHFHNQGLSRLEALQAAKTQDVTINSIFKKKVPYSAAVIDYLTSWTLSIPG